MGSKQKILRLIPALPAVGLVPLIVIVKQYDLDLYRYAWFMNSDSSIDLFLYWKGQALIFLAFLMAAAALFSLVGRKENQPDWKKMKVPEMACLGIYLVFAVVSALMSDYRDTAVFGGYEQWEGMIVLLSYGVLLAFVYLMVDSEQLVRLVVYAVIAGGFVIGLIGTFQYLGMDLFRGSFGQALMNLFSETKMKFSFNFSEGWVYATLYNPNYVGSYAALVLPLLIAVAAVEWKKIPRFWTILSMVGICLMVVTLLGSQSLTGCVGVIVSGIFVVAYRFPRLLASLGAKKMAVSAGCVAVLAVVCCVLFPEQIKTGTDKLFHPKEDTHVLRELMSTEQGLEVTTVNSDTMYLNISGGTDGAMSASDSSGNALLLKVDSEKKCCYPEDSRFSDFRFYPVQVESGGEQYPAVRIVTASTGKEWNVALKGNEYLIYSVYGKLDKLRKIPAWGFENCQHFGDKRGYIWSRTFPLLKKYMVIGAGPNTFTEIFPNDDYVGKNNMNYNGVTVTKPHNLYLQIWAQTGFVSLLAFLALFLLYFIKGLKLYWKRPLETVTEKIGFAVMAAVFGYMVTGIANDSTVAVAPVFWALLGLGMAVNRMIDKTTERHVP